MNTPEGRPEGALDPSEWLKVPPQFREDVDDPSHRDVMRRKAMKALEGALAGADARAAAARATGELDAWRRQRAVPLATPPHEEQPAPACAEPKRPSADTVNAIVLETLERAQREQPGTFVEAVAVPVPKWPTARPGATGKEARAPKDRRKVLAASIARLRANGFVVESAPVEGSGYRLAP